MTDLRHVRNFESLIRYLEEELDWPLDGYEMEDLTFDYEPADLGLKAEDAAAVKSIKQLRPLNSQQPWGIFFIEFDKKKLPVVVLRCILSHLVFKKRASANKADRAAWNSHDLLFISAFGPEDEAGREIGFAHFHEESGDLPSLRVLGWDGADTTLKLQTVASTLKDRLRWPEKGETVDAWRERWSRAFRHRPGHVIKTSDMLAEALAALAKRISDAAQTKIKHETESGPLRSLHRAFQTNLIHDLTEDGFADTYAQTITYGLLTAAINRTDMAGGKHGTFVKADDVSLSIKPTSPFLKEMLETFLKVGGRKSQMDFDELGVQDVVELLRSDVTDIPAILADFGNRTRGEDPVIHFYEHFLGAYNKQLKIQRGVFYTPQPVVSYIVRSVHELLQTEFGLEHGLADTTTWGEFIQKSKITNPQSEISLPPLTDQPGETRTISPDEPFVQILDPATGTATFLVEVIDVIHRTLKEKWKAQRLNPAQQREAWNDYVPKHLLPRLHGYELMMAPYAIAHMKIGLKLTELGYEFQSDARARIYLSNALEPWVRDPKFPEFEALAHEAAAVNEIKRHKRFTVVIGNPPYTVMSANLSEYARALIASYRFVDGERLKEKSMLRLEMHLQDDYIKFFRIGQVAIDLVGCGVFGYVSNHSFLDNPTLRGMRQSLQNTFSKLWLYDLHGNSKKKDDAPSDVQDKNVFDIQQGVAISLGLRLPCSQSQHVASHSDLFGSRDTKYRHLAASVVTETTWGILQPSSPSHLLVPQDITLRAEFNKAICLLEIMPLNSCGVVSGREGLNYDLDQEALEGRIDLFCDPNHSDDWVRQKFDIRDAGGYELSKRRRMILGKKASSFTRRIDIKPFDTRWVAYTRGVLTSDQSNVMSHMLGTPNIGLITTRQTKEAWGAFVTRHPIAHKAVSAYDVSSLFPLYLHADSNSLNLSGATEPNLSHSFLRAMANALGVSQKGEDGLPLGLTSATILHYIYAVFHSPGYRSRYAEFLKIDFPRLPLTGDLELFRKLACLGAELVALHLLESPKLDQSITEFIGSSKEITKVGYTDHTVWINAGGTKGKNTPGTCGFHGVPEAVWNFHIGGYQVCEKWLKDRKGRTLTAEDIAHYHKIVVALSETIRLMAEIDEVIAQHGGWPGAFQTAQA